MDAIEKPTLLLAGGGTGGHVLAGIAVADSWRVHWGSEAPVLFVGAIGGMEGKLVPKASYPLELLWVGSLNRVSMKRRMKTIFQLPLSFLKSVRILIKVKPRYVLGVGGYASGPVLLMARVLQVLGLLKVRIAILEQNSVPGFTNRILGRFVDRVFAAFPGTEGQFPNHRVKVTGNPIRSTMKPMLSASRDPFTIFIFGGSQGAIGINTLVLEALPYLEDLSGKLKWVHQTGEKDLSRVLEGYQKQGVSARVEAFIYDMPSVYQEASLLICRAGSSTLSEIAAVGRATILIPLPTAADNHQEHNARVFSDCGAATLFVQEGVKGEDLAKMIRDLFNSPQRLKEMETKVIQFFMPKAADEIVQGLLG